MSMACAGERVVGIRGENRNSNSSGHSWLLSTKSSNQSNLQLQRSRVVSRITIQLRISYTPHPTKYVSQGRASRVCRLHLILLGSRNWSGLGKQPHLSSHLTYLSKDNAVPCSCASEDTDTAFGPPPSLSMCPFLPCQLLVSVSIQKPPLEGAAGHCWASLRATVITGQMPLLGFLHPDKVDSGQVDDVHYQELQLRPMLASLSDETRSRSLWCADEGLRMYLSPPA